MVRFLTVVSFALLMAGTGLAPVAEAQAPQSPPTRVRGTVESLDGQTLVVKSREGPLVTVALAPNFAVRSVVPRTLADIKAGDYVASTSVRDRDGKLRAIEVHIFSEAQRGQSEGQFPWDLVPDSIMTNAFVTGIAAAPQGGTMKVKFKDGEAEVIVPSDVPVVAYGPGDASLLKKGAAVFVVARPGQDGTLAAPAVTAEKDGVKPPM
jgi:hypothetical protein